MDRAEAGDELGHLAARLLLTAELARDGHDLGDVRESVRAVATVLTAMTSDGQWPDEGPWVVG